MRSDLMSLAKYAIAVALLCPVLGASEVQAATGNEALPAPTKHEPGFAALGQGLHLSKLSPSALAAIRGEGSGTVSLVNAGLMQGWLTAAFASAGKGAGFQSGGTTAPENITAAFVVIQSNPAP
jgi:hypothetical protein